MIFLASLFGAPCPEMQQKKFVSGPAFGSSLFSAKFHFALLLLGGK
jgi:hypothetical protein